MVITTPRCGGFEVDERVTLDGEWAQGTASVCEWSVC